MYQMTRIRDKRHKPITVWQCLFRDRGHFHQVNIEMQQPRMIPGGRVLVKSAFQYRPRLFCRSIWCRLPRGRIPKRPRRAIHQCLDENCSHVEIVRKFLVDRAHRVREAFVPRAIVFDCGVGRKARSQRVDQCALNVLGGQRRRLGQKPMRTVQRVCFFIGFKEFP